MSVDPERITGYVDGALTEAEREEVETLLRDSAEARAQLEGERELRERLRGLPSPEPRPQLEARIRARLRRERAPRRSRLWLAMAAALVLGLLWARSSPQVLLRELVWDHHKCFGHDELPAQVWSDDALVVHGWFADEGSRIPLFPERVGELTLVGGRYCPLLGASLVPHLYYASRSEQLSVFVVDRWLRLEDSLGGELGGVAVHLQRMAGTRVGLVASEPEVLAAFRRALSVTRADAGLPAQLTGTGATASLILVSPRGAVAQLGARVNGIHEVMGSIPISSTNSFSDLAGRP